MKSLSNAADNNNLPAPTVNANDTVIAEAPPVDEVANESIEDASLNIHDTTRAR